MNLSAPELLATDHELRTFSSGVTTLDEWLKRRVMTIRYTGSSQTVVVCDARRIFANYYLASSTVAMVEATGRFRRHTPIRYLLSFSGA